MTHGCRKGRVKHFDSPASFSICAALTSNPANKADPRTLTACISFCRPALFSSLPHPIKTSHVFRPISTCHKLDKTSDQTMPHVKARCKHYPGSKVKRFPVPDDKVDWSKGWQQYHPVSYTAPSVLNKPVWADPDIG